MFSYGKSFIHLRGQLYISLFETQTSKEIWRITSIFRNANQLEFVVFSKEMVSFFYSLAYTLPITSMKFKKV